MAKKEDNTIFELLESEANRCKRVIERLTAELEGLPRGSLGKRTVKSAGKEYVYPCLKLREAGKVVTKHLTENGAEELGTLILRRKKLILDLKSHKIRLKTIEKIIKKR